MPAAGSILIWEDTDVIRKHLLRNRSLVAWIAAGAALYSGGCDVAGGILGTTFSVLDIVKAWT